MDHQDIKQVLIPQEELARKVAELGAQISRDYTGKKLMVISVLKGSVVFLGDLIREITVPLVMDFMAVSSYGAGVKTSGVVRINKDLDLSIEGFDVLIVEDILDSGMTLSYIKKEFAQRGAASVRIATLLDKPARRRVELDVDYSCFVIPDAFVVGYGLDYDEKYRNLPDIGVLHPRIYTK